MSIPISPVGASKPELTISAAAVNAEPIELDGRPTSPEHARRGSKAELHSELSPQEREKRAQLISERKEDPAVLVDIPQTPDADEFERAIAIDEQGLATKN
ncbi:hypothetical protein LTR56_012770 [Elasticomyces elasticus]|nr:hypothetical protein LTR22_026757 [Elasticomyces elasticus]KAK3638857.1 hypothetical protein LTR56_012770 [Elasticomyces elasticus]KAK4918623.1 hypothetical protein LTR49_013693 [Elasticomyces elasticus]KAK5720890.1 hypothetical protein LTR15_006852 [Elasticomyces elasticus]KAK5735887.1 hypothetical protein LTS12_026342 [Elasticomyces elasticus]